MTKEIKKRYETSWLPVDIDTSILPHVLKFQNGKDGIKNDMRFIPICIEKDDSETGGLDRGHSNRDHKARSRAKNSMSRRRFHEAVPKDDTSLAEQARPENGRCEEQFKRYGRR